VLAHAPDELLADRGFVLAAVRRNVEAHPPQRPSASPLQSARTQRVATRAGVGLARSGGSHPFCPLEGLQHVPVALRTERRFALDVLAASPAALGQLALGGRAQRPWGLAKGGA